MFLTVFMSIGTPRSSSIRRIITRASQFPFQVRVLVLTKKSSMGRLWRSSHLSDVDKDDCAYFHPSPFLPPSFANIPSLLLIFHLIPTASHQTVHIHLDGPPKSKSQEGPVEVWFLLTRHRTDTRRTSEYISLHIEVDDVQSLSSLQHLPVQVRFDRGLCLSSMQGSVLNFALCIYLGELH